MCTKFFPLSNTIIPVFVNDSDTLQSGVGVTYTVNKIGCDSLKSSFSLCGIDRITNIPAK